MDILKIMRRAAIPLLVSAAGLVIARPSLADNAGGGEQSDNATVTLIAPPVLQQFYEPPQYHPHELHQPVVFFLPNGDQLACNDDDSATYLLHVPIKLADGSDIDQFRIFSEELTLSGADNQTQKVLGLASVPLGTDSGGNPQAYEDSTIVVTSGNPNNVDFRSLSLKVTVQDSIGTTHDMESGGVDGSDGVALGRSTAANVGAISSLCSEARKYLQMRLNQ